MNKLSVPVREWFDIQRGKSKFTKSYGDSHPGEYPVYSASLAGPMTFIDEHEFSGPLLTFTTNGYGGTVQVLPGDFSVNGDRAVMVPKPGVRLPDLRYLARVLEDELRPLAIGRIADKGKNEYTKVKPSVASEVELPILVDEDGELDYAAMREFGEAVERATNLQHNIHARAEQILSTNVILDAGEVREVRLGDENYFGVSIGKRVLRDDLSGDGTIPVYSANARAPMGYVHQSEWSRVYEHPCLIWGIDGIFDWNFIPAGQEFVPTDHCGVLLVDNVNIDVEYLLYALRSTRDQYGFDRVFRAKLEHIVDVEVPIPVTSDGQFDLDRQRQLAEKYRQMERISDELLTRIQQLTEVVVTPLL